MPIALLVVAGTLLLAAAPAPAAAPTTSAAGADAATLRPCFGAASRDPLKPCANPALRLRVFPAPSNAALEANAPCIPGDRTELLYPCKFGLRRPAVPTETIALIGDSHASHWRAAVEVIADRKQLPAVSLARSRCPFIDATVNTARQDRRRCRAWNREVMAYLRRHGEISTVFLSARSSADFVPARGMNNFDTQVAGHIALWRSLPPSIKHIVVLRDTPRGSGASALCVQRAFTAKRPAGRRCARSRSAALRTDPAVVAARRMRSPRVHAIDLSRFFCDARWCFPVVGGAFVYKDADHITAVFARTLGPYLLRGYEEILRSAPSSVRGPLDALAPDERAAAECLIGERLAAARAGGFHMIGPEHLARAEACRDMLERRALELRTAGLDGERNRANRYAVIRAVLDT